MNFLEEFKKYESGLLSPDDESDFEKRLKMDDELAEKYQMFRMQNLLIDASIEHDISEDIIAIHKENKHLLEETPSPKSIPFWKSSTIIRVAAAILLLVGLGWVLNRNLNQKINYDDALALDISAEIDSDLYDYSGLKSGNREEIEFEANKKLLSSSNIKEIKEATVWFQNKSLTDNRFKFYWAQGLFKVRNYLYAAIVFETFLKSCSQSDSLKPKAEVFRIIALHAGGQKEIATAEAKKLLSEKSKHPFQNQLSKIIK